MANSISNITIGGVNQQIGGDNFDGQWIFSALTLADSITLSGESNNTYSLAEYLPDDDYDYEIACSVSGTTTSTSGNMFEYNLYAGTGTSGIMKRICRAVTRASSTQRAAGTCILPISKTDRNLTLRSAATYNSTAYIRLRGYRRIGLNGTGSNYITNINCNNISYPLYAGGETTDYAWLRNSTKIFESTLTANQIAEIDLSEILGNNNYKYLATFSVFAYTGTTSGNSVIIRLGNSNNTSGAHVCSQITRTSSSMICGGNIVLPVVNTNKKIYLAHTGSGTSGTVTVYIRNYRRIGTNA